ncbi:MAG: nucleolar RNA-binding Nop10p family protein [Candidatus Thermoplasmatota archaeon]|nr:nucleolar RNA-binding Nop10p family protein [Candidatus Thermoplasmatota archaeon]
MARQLLQHCTKCKSWTLNRDCPHCDGMANAAAPMKWSPEDQRASIRRKMYNVESQECLESLPEMEKISDTRANSTEEE